MAMTYNCKRKFYPDGQVQQVAVDSPIFRRPLSADDEPDYSSSAHTGSYAMQEVRKDNLKRVREKIFDICALNPFDYFITWTLNPELVDRYSPAEVLPKIRTCLNHMQQRYDLRYIVVPEYHKDKAIHFHGLISGDLRMVPSGKTDTTGHTIYNMPQWKYGFSTAIPLYGDSQAVARYMTKYITKDLSKIFGKFYFSSRGLSRSVPVQYDIIDYDRIGVQEHRNVFGYKYLTFRLEDMQDG